MELKNNVESLEARMDRVEALINAVHNDAVISVKLLRERVDVLEKTMDTAITMAAHELIQFLRENDIQKLDEKEFADTVKDMIYACQLQQYGATVG